MVPGDQWAVEHVKTVCHDFDGVQELKDVSTKILSEIQVGLYLFVLVV